MNNYNIYFRAGARRKQADWSEEKKYWYCIFLCYNVPESNLGEKQNGIKRLEQTGKIEG
jgi:hypothetical protein